MFPAVVVSFDVEFELKVVVSLDGIAVTKMVGVVLSDEEAFIEVETVVLPATVVAPATVVLATAVVLPATVVVVVAAVVVVDSSFFSSPLKA